MSNRINITGTIGTDEKDAFNYIASNYVVSPSLAKIPGFTTKLLKACEELNGVISFNYPSKTFSIVVEGVTLKEEYVELENDSTEEEVNDSTNEDEEDDEIIGTDDSIEDDSDWN